MGKRRYLLLIDALGSGGAERQMGYLAYELQKAGHEVKLCTFFNTADFYTVELKAKGIDVEEHIEGQPLWKRPFVIRRLAKALKPDMVIAYKDGAAAAACIAKLLAPFRLTVSERNTTQVLTPKERLKFNLYRFANHIVPNSFSQADFIKKHYPMLASKVKVITNMVDTDRFRPSHESKPENNPLRVITVGRIVPQKNLLNFVRAVAILKSRCEKFHFDWYGGENISDPEYFESVKKLVFELGVSELISFHPPVNDIEHEYHNHDIFLLPSSYEGFPNVLCEAMACGLPVVATAVCDSSRIMTDHRFHAIPSSPESIADAISRIANLTIKQRIEIGKSNSNRIVALCSPETFLKSYLSLN